MKILEWVGAHYVPTGISLFTLGASLLVAVLGTALAEAGPRARWPRRLAACAGIFLVLIGAASAAAKLRWPYPLRQLPWAGPPVVGAFGLLLILSAWLSLRHFRKRAREHLGPLAAAAWQTVERFPWENPEGVGVVLRTPNGQPLIRELLSVARRRRSTRVTLLEAPAGAGKSAALVELANRCHTAQSEKRGRTVVPVYIDLAAFTDKVERPALRAFILAEMNLDDRLAGRIEAAWGDSSLGAAWLFLFDNADRLLARWPGTDGTYNWASELSGFLGANGRDSAAVVAGRAVPSVPGAVRVEIAPLDDRSRRAFLKSRDVAPGPQEVVWSGKSFRPYMGNPGWLDFISPYLAEYRHDTPKTFYELMGKCIDERMPEGVMGKRFRAAAEDLAILLYNNAEEGQANLKTALAQQLGRDREGSPDEVLTSLDGLVSLGLVSSYLDKDGRERLQFSHDSFEAYFATARLLLADPATLDLERLLTARRWTAIAVSLLQYGHEDMVRALTLTAEKILTRATRAPMESPEDPINRFLLASQIPERTSAPERIVRPPWPTVALTVLRVFDAGLKPDNLDAVNPLRDEADRLIADAFANCTKQEQAQIIEVQRLAHDDVAAALCVTGLRSQSGSLVTVATAQITSRYELLDLFPLRDRVRLMLAVALLGLNPATVKQVSPASHDRLTFASESGKVTAPLIAIFYGLAGLVDIIAHPETWRSALLEVAVSAAVVAAIAATRRRTGGREWLIAQGLNPPFWAIAILAMVGAIGLVSSVVDVLKGTFPSLLDLLTVGMLLWPLSALYYLAIEPAPTRSRWIFPFGVIARPAWSLLWTRRSGVITVPSKRTLGGVIVVIVCLADVLLLSVIMKAGWRLPSDLDGRNYNLVIGLRWLAWLVLAGCLFILPAIDSLHDVKWVRRWTPPGHVTDKDFISWLTQIRTTRGAISMLSAMERRVPAKEAQAAAGAISDFYRSLALVNTLPRKQRPSITHATLKMIGPLRTSGFGEWLTVYDQKHPGRLRSIAQKHEKPLGDYLNAIQQSSLDPDEPSQSIAPSPSAR